MARSTGNDAIGASDALGGGWATGLRRERTTWLAYAGATLLVIATTGVAILSRALFPVPDLEMFYLVVVLIAALKFGQGPAILSALLGVAAYDFFLVPPVHTLAVSDDLYVLTFLMMSVVGVVISKLTFRVRQEQERSRQREVRTAALYSLSRELGSALDERQAARVLARHSFDVFGVSTLVAVGDVDDPSATVAVAGELPSWLRLPGPALSSDDRLVRFPLVSGGAVHGSLVVVPVDPGQIGADELGLLEAFAQQGALAIERARLSEEAKNAATRAHDEELRSSLLSATSHDLRTPLAAITGAATTLRDEADGLGAAEKRGLLDTICEEAERLEHLVANLLEMTRLESGGLKIKRDWVPLEEMVDSALTRLDSQLGSRDVHVAIPADLPLASVDPVLFEQVFVNLLENAAKYTPASSPIEIEAATRDGTMRIEVRDCGPGLAPGTEELVFDKFYRAPHGRGGGVGLGLAICRGIVRAHGGTIRAENRKGGGVLFRIDIPLGESAPAMPNTEVLA
jgi:two-component system, OmpR family, sensor histidine kinase KdpD